jgi:hypothetical protein
MLLWLPAGLLLPMLSGWLLVRLCEGQNTVLFRMERWTLGFLFGVTATMFVTFLANVSGLILFTRLGFLAVQLVLVILLGALWLYRHFRTREGVLLPPHLNPNPPLPPTPYPLRPPLVILLILLALWTLAKIAFGSFILVTTPSYFDDTLKNWNLRAKVFTLTHTLDTGTAQTPATEGLNGYPPTVSLAKASLVALAGQWDEGLVNSIHVLWFLAALILLFCALTHRTSWQWALPGTYLLASLPLYCFDGLNAYADVFLSAHLFAAVALTVRGLTEADVHRRQSLLRLAALAAGLLIFTKNEALVLYLPLLLLVLVGGILFLRRPHPMTRREVVMAIAWTAGWLLAIGLPWILFKWAHGLPFGNAKPIAAGFSVGWQPGVLGTLWINAFFEGNWHLLFPLLLLLLVTGRKHLLRSSLTPLVLFVLAALGLQIALFLFTPLSVEALQQTGIARGFVQLAPLVVLLITFLARDVVKGQ